MTVQGLAYLHHDCSPQILHRDVKSSNILLDLDYEAHVADFGIAKTLSTAYSNYMSNVAGSRGYIAPGKQINFQMYLLRGGGGKKKKEKKTPCISLLFPIDQC